MKLQRQSSNKGLLSWHQFYQALSVGERAMKNKNLAHKQSHM
jgi:hypothetical protein